MRSVAVRTSLDRRLEKTWKALASELVRRGEIIQVSSDLTWSAFMRDLGADEAAMIGTRVTINSLGVHTDELAHNFHQSSADPRTDNSKERRALQLGFVGRIDPQKGIHVLIDALGILRQHNVAFSCEIIGGSADINYLKYVKRRMRKLDLDDVTHLRITNIPWEYEPIENASVRRFWSSLDIGVFPSVFVEGFGISLLEGMAEGAVPIVSESGPMGQIVRHEVDGAVVPRGDSQALADAIMRIGMDRHLMRSMSVASRMRISHHYTLSGHVDRLLSGIR